MLLILVFYSNYHQTYRGGNNNETPLLEAILNFNITFENLSDRMPMWKFNNIIYEKNQYQRS